MPINLTKGPPSAGSAGFDRVEVPQRILFGHSEAMHAIRVQLEKVAETDVPVLIVGEIGTGKEAIARYLHSVSQRSQGPFARINCAAIPGKLLEAELFGYENSAFPGSYVTQPGLVELAADGTCFLDDIGELELSLQSRLLDFLQDGQFSRIGAQGTFAVDPRIVCAASRPLEAEVESARFRPDLLYRINVVTLPLPPLRERRLDIPELIDFFLRGFSAELGRTPRPIRASTREMLVAGHWPGNIRQLKNLMKRYVILDSEDAIRNEICGTAPLSTAAPPLQSQGSLKEVTREATRELEKKLILDFLSTNHWNRKNTAQALHISYRALLYKMKQAGLPSKKLNRGHLPGS